MLRVCASSSACARAGSVQSGGGGVGGRWPPALPPRLLNGSAAPGAHQIVRILNTYVYKRILMIYEYVYKQ